MPRALFQHEYVHSAVAADGDRTMPEPMPISAEGLALVKHFEGYHKAQPDGSCTAYLCPAGVPTLGFGSTHGVKLGMRWTREEAEAALMRELAVYAAAVDRNVTVPLSVQQRDALVSFTYNLGETNLRRSTLLRKLNRGDYEGAEREFGKWVKARKGAGGPLVTYAGLVRRRKAEAAMFGDNDIVAVPLPVPNTVPEAVEPSMPQAPEAANTKVPWWSSLGAAAAGVAAWFGEQAETVATWLTGVGTQFMGLSPVTSIAHQAGVAVVPVMVGITVLCGIVAAKAMLKPDEVVE